jgi:hypothetical protein
LRTDKNRIRAQSAILDKTPVLSLLLSITVFLCGYAFHPHKKTVGARSAQIRP